ncbi:MAG: phage BR0599 family protein [Stellaceae bacterium]
MLDAIGDQARYIGPIGSATVAKLVHNMSGYALVCALAETFAMGVKAGVEPLALWEAVRQGADGRRYTFDALINQWLPGKYDPPDFSLKLAHKDVGLATAVGRELGLPMRICELAYAEMTEAMNRGWAQRDSRVGGLLQVERAFMPSYGVTTPGTVVLFAGRVSDIDASRTGLDLKCRSHLELLNIQMPRRLYQPSCNHVFGDAMCQFDRTSLALTITAIAGSSQGQVNWSGSLPTTPFAQGTITGLTGANAGQARTISQVIAGPTVTVKLPFLSPVAVGDTFQLLPGCDHTLATCTNVFNNAGRHGGFEFIPTPENAV